MAKVVLGYWKIRGLGQVLRLLLSYTGIQFEQVNYETRQKWFDEDKKNIGFDFPNLPYLIDGDFKLTQSAAIAKYIIQKSGKTDLLGKDAHDQGRVESLIGVFNDALKQIRGLFWNKDHEAIKIETLQKARPKLNYLRQFVGQNQFALGYLTLADFYLAQSLSYFQTLYPSEKNHYKFWWRIRRNFENLPQIKAYYLRPDAVHGPHLPPYAAVSAKQRKITLGYWGIRGLAQVPRLLLSYSGVKFQDKLYTNGDDWFKNDKTHLGLQFPNLPYLIDGDFNLTESGAIQRYIVRRWGKTQLLGKTAQDNAKLESYLSLFNQISGAVRGLFFNQNHETAKGPLIQKYRSKLQQLAKFVGEKEFVLGYLTLADFITAQDSYYIERVYPEEYKHFSFLQRIRDNFNKLPQISGYYASQTAFKGRFFPEYAKISVEQ